LRDVHFGLRIAIHHLMLLRNFCDRFIQDVRYAARGLRENSTFTAAVTLILALGIGANTAVFSLVSGLVLKSLPVERPDELVLLARPAFSYPIFKEVQSRGSSIFANLFSWTIDDFAVDWSRQPEMAQVLLASEDFYATLGINAIQGRTFSVEDDVAVISYDLWERRFARDPGIIGKVIRVGRQPMTIIGVTPKGFFGVAPGMAPELTIPLRAYTKVRPEQSDAFRQSTSSWLHIMGRLKPGITITQAGAAFQTFWPHVLETVTDPNQPPARRARFLSRITQLESARAGFSRVRNGVFRPLMILSALAGLLLLIGCATIANLLLARASSRRQEMAVRVAIGASRGRIVNQLLTEGLVLSALGGLGGLFIAAWTSSGLISLLSTTDDRIQLVAVIDRRVLAFTMALSIVTAVIFAMVPALRAAAVDVSSSLKEDARVRGLRPRSRLARSLVIVQVGLSMILIVGAALFARSLNAILSQDAGFQRDNLLTVSMDPTAAGYNGTRLLTFYDELLERLRNKPGVQTVSLSVYAPISPDGSWTETIGIDGNQLQQNRENMTLFNPISPGFFRTVGLPLLKGRDFGRQDDSSGERTVIVNESFARAFFPNTDPLGHHINVGLDPSRQGMEIIGVVQDAKYQTLQEPSRKMAYQPWLQLKEAENFVIEVRATDSSKGLANLIRREIREMDRSIPVKVETIDERIRESLVSERVVAVLSAVLGIVALLLASMGLYGLMAYQVNRRTNEIGLRMSLGANRWSILTLVLRESLMLAGIGVLIGIGASIALGRIVRGMLYGISSSDPAAFIFATLAMAAMAMIAGYLPARRASRVDPASALRRE
jgi:putative ABC transport system permease protein